MQLLENGLETLQMGTAYSDRYPLLLMLNGRSKNVTAFPDYGLSLTDEVSFEFGMLRPER